MISGLRWVLRKHKGRPMFILQALVSDDGVSVW